MSNFSKALKELTGFDSDNEQTAQAKEPAKKRDYQEPAKKRDFQETTKKRDYQEPERKEDFHVTEKREEVKTEAPKVVVESPRKVTEDKDAAFDFGIDSFDIDRSDVVAQVPVDFSDLEIDENATEISDTMVVSGNIKTDDDILLEGHIYGDVVSTANFKSVGVHVGNLRADRISLVGAKQKGDVDSKSNAVIGDGSMVIGNLRCSNTRISGKVKGNLHVNKTFELLGAARIFGDVDAETFLTTPTARVVGNVKLRGLVTKDDEDFEFDFGGEC